MHHNTFPYHQTLSHYVGWSLIATIVIGIVTAVLISSGIDVNMSADISQTAENMLQAEERLRAKAYIGLLIVGIECFVAVGLFSILREHGPVLATWVLVVGIAAAVLSMLGSVYAMNAALIAGNPGFDQISNDSQRLIMTSLQVTSDYTSFHLSLALASVAKVGVFYLFFKSKLIPQLISVWGMFASIFVALTLVSRDFIPLLSHNVVTGMFMVSNLIAILALGLYLGIKGIREN